MPIVYNSVLRAMTASDVDAVEAFLESMREWIGRKDKDVALRFSSDTHLAQRGRDGAYYRWEPFADNEDLLCEFSIRHRDDKQHGIWWSAKAILLQSAGETRIAITVDNMGPEIGKPGALYTSRPRVVLALGKRFDLRYAGDGYPLGCSRYGEDEVDDLVRYRLMDHERVRPVIVLAPEMGDRFLVEPSRFEDEFYSLGELVILKDSAAAFALTAAVGSKERSCFAGAIRAYMPGFDRKSDPHKHPLLLPWRVEQQRVRTNLAQYLALHGAKLQERLPGLEIIRDKRAVQYEEDAKHHREVLKQKIKDSSDTASYEEYLAYVENENRALLDKVAQLEQENRSLSAHRELLAAKIATIKEYEGEGLDSDLITIESAEDAVRLAQQAFADQLVFLDSCMKTIKECQYREPQRIYDALSTLADLHKMYAEGRKGLSRKSYIQSKGFVFGGGIAKHTKKKDRERYHFSHKGKILKCYEHIGQGKDLDPKSCFRIYYEFSDGMAYIGHIGRHLDSILTNKLT